YSISVKAVPSMGDVAQGRISVADLTNIDVSDLLGRQCVEPSKALLSKCILGANVLVTGAGGSIGSELCRQILKQNPARIVLFELTEFALYQIERELQQHAHSDIEIIAILGNVQDKFHLLRVMQSYQINTVYHAAAYKHVPLVEHNVFAGLRNNVFGTLNCAEAAVEAAVDHFVLVSTDKAVRPTNVMGATKRLAELVLQAITLRGDHSTQFSMVRFGNVLGSSGSVIPLFKQQIRSGGPVTVTHPEVTRYFMTIPEAASLVIQAGAMGGNGEVFVLDMGEPVRIVDLAKEMISLSGCSLRTEENPEGDIAIEFSGLRPGEKLYEELLIGDNVQGTDHAMIMRAQEDALSWPEMEQCLQRFEKSITALDYKGLMAAIEETAQGYKPETEIFDHLYVAQRTS
ncbi:MAG: UDP-N-acetylglucosamine 4,6-dehydratase family protein, partial [Pontibacterium sp.]